MSAAANLPGRLARLSGRLRGRAARAGDAGRRHARRPAEIARLVAQPGFAVYRNTVMKGCIDALQANYPAVSRLVGEEWFRAAAAIYARANLPRQPTLLDYGAGFAEFLAAFEPAAELPYLAGVARLDRFWTEAHVARDEVPVAAAARGRIRRGGARPRRCCVRMRPRAGRGSTASPSPRSGSATVRGKALLDAEEGVAPDLDWRAEGMLITRPRGAVQWTLLGKGDCAFLDACAVGARLAEAAMAALDADPQADLAALLALTLDAGAFRRIGFHDDDPWETMR